MNGPPGMGGTPGTPGMVGPPGPPSGGERILPACCYKCYYVIRFPFASVAFYFRWGSVTCPGVLLYLGQIVKARSAISEREGGYLCLADNPTPSNVRLEKPELATRLVNIHDKEAVPCTACATRKDTVIVIPNTPLCPPGWTVEYSGVLASNPKHPVDNICVDNAEAAKLLKSKSYDLAAVTETMAYKENYAAEAAVACVVCSI